MSSSSTVTTTTGLRDVRAESSASWYLNLRNATSYGFSRTFRCANTCVSVRVRVRVSVRVRVRVSVLVRVRVRMRARVLCMRIYVHVSTYTLCVHACACVCVRVRARVCACVCTRARLRQYLIIFGRRCHIFAPRKVFRSPAMNALGR